MRTIVLITILLITIFMALVWVTIRAFKRADPHERREDRGHLPGTGDGGNVADFGHHGGGCDVSAADNGGTIDGSGGGDCGGGD
jgi:hypothetical protein